MRSKWLLVVEDTQSDDAPCAILEQLMNLHAANSDDPMGSPVRNHLTRRKRRPRRPLAGTGDCQKASGRSNKTSQGSHHEDHYAPPKDTETYDCATSDPLTLVVDCALLKFPPMRRSRALLVLAASLIVVPALAVVPSGGAAQNHTAGTPVRVGTIDPDSGNVKSTDLRATVAGIPDGNAVTVTVPNALAPLDYAFRVPLSKDETLVSLPFGGAAVAVPQADYVDAPGDATVPDPGSGQDEAAVYGSIPDDPNDPTDNPDNGPPDATDYPDGASVAPTRDGMGIVADALDQTGGSLVAAAVDPPSATDALGHVVSVVLSVTGDRVIVSIAPRAGVAFPVTINLLAGYDMDYQPASPSLDTLAVKGTNAACGPDDGPKVIVSYDGKGWQAMVGALANQLVPCATYYVLVPSVDGGITPRPNSAALIRAYDGQNSVGATFVPVSVIHYDSAKAPFVRAGGDFATLMEAAGYNTWAIDEAPHALVTPKSTDWNKLVRLVSGLASGGKKGIVLDVYTRQSTSLAVLRSYKTQLKRLLSQIDGKSNFQWQALGSGTAYWAEETYTQCSLVCIGGKKLSTMAQRTNEYMQHTPRLAFAADAPDGVVARARDFLQSRYLPLTNGWWSNDPSDGYQTSGLPLVTMQGLASLQIYAGRAWMAAGNPYAGSRVGVRWNGTPPSRQKNPKGAQAALAARIAAAIKGAYQPGGTSRGACKSSKGGGGVSICQPSGGAAFTKDWSIFEAWGARQPQGGGQTCTAGDGGPPTNDSFANAQPLPVPLDIDSNYNLSEIPVALAGATIETDEPAPQGVSACNTVWFSWDAPLDNIEFMFTLAGSDAPVFQGVWTGSGLGDLAPVERWSYGRNDATHFTIVPTAGVRYYIQVGTSDFAPPPAPFTLQWQYLD